MGKRRAYRATAVKNVVLAEVFEAAVSGPIEVGLDIGKGEILAVVRWCDGSFERPWKVKNPTEIHLLVTLLQVIAQERAVRVAMESTGTYGDPLRQALSDAGLEVHRVSGKATSDYAEIFDGVPSNHDGKDAAIVAELAALGKAWPWPFEPKQDDQAEMEYWVDWLDAQQGIEMIWLGRLEGLLARHWPELTALLALNSVTLLELLARYGGPAGLAADPQAAHRLAGWGGSRLRGKKIEAVVASAESTMGVRQNRQEVRQLRQYAAIALAAYRETQKARRMLKGLAKGNAVIERQAEAVGAATACVLWVTVGKPEDYHCGEAYRKAMGLNLKERSSGRHKGKLKITKRGPAMARRWLYFAAMRLAQQPEVRRWYEAKKARDHDRGTGALIGIARKLALALYRVGVEEKPFEPGRLFPGRPLPPEATLSGRAAAPN